MNPGLVAVVISITSTALAAFFIILRCISRILILRDPGADDVFAIVAFIASLVYTCLLYIQYQHGLGQELSQVNFPELFMMLKYMWAGIIAFGVGMTCLGLSALAQFLRLFFERGYRILCWILIVMTVIFGISATIVDIFMCWPIDYAWNKLLPHGKCISLLIWWYFAATYIIIMSIIMVGIPIVAFKDLNIRRGQKRALIGVFALSGFEVATSILRLFSIKKAVTGTNFTRDAVEVTYWASLEMNVGIICICLPPLKALYASISSRWKTDADPETLSQSITLNAGSAVSHSSGPDESSSSIQKIERDPYAIP